MENNLFPSTPLLNKPAGVFLSGMQNLNLAERCYAALGDVARTHYLRETVNIAEEYENKNGENAGPCPEVWARLAILSNDLVTAENIYLEQGDIEAAIEMYKKLHRWDEALR